jgi:hypothetical protein
VRYLRVKVTKLRYGRSMVGVRRGVGGGDVRHVRRRAVGWVARRGYDSTAARGCGACGATEADRDDGSTVHGPAGRSRPRRPRDAGATARALDSKAKTNPTNPL